MDVERSVVSIAIPLRRLHIPSVQQLRSLQAVESSRFTMASLHIKSSVLGTVCWKYAHNSLGCPAKASRQD